MSRNSRVALAVVTVTVCIILYAAAWLAFRAERDAMRSIADENQALGEQNRELNATLLEVLAKNGRIANEATRDRTELKIKVVADSQTDAGAHYRVEVLPAEAAKNDTPYVSETVAANETLDCGVLKVGYYEFRVTMPLGSRARKKYYLSGGRGHQTVTFNAPSGEEPEYDLALEFEWPARLAHILKRPDQPFEAGLLCEIEHAPLPALLDGWHWEDEPRQSELYLLNIDGTLDVIRESRQEFTGLVSTVAAARIANSEEEIPEFYYAYLAFQNESISRHQKTAARWRGQKHVIRLLGLTVSGVKQEIEGVRAYQILNRFDCKDVAECHIQLQPGTVNRAKLDLPDRFIEWFSEPDEKMPANEEASEDVDQEL